MAERTNELTRGDEPPLGGTESLDPSDRAADSDDTGAIRADIRETRERMSDTLEEIGERLNPSHITEQVKQNVRDATIGRVENMARTAADRVSETGQTVTDTIRQNPITNTIRQNPIPAAMVGIGLGWLIASGRRQGSHTGERYTRTQYGYGGGSPYESGGYAGGTGGEPGTMERVRERAGEVGQSVKETAGGLANRAQETVGQVTTRAQDVAGTVAERSRYQARRLEDRFYENPLAIGAVTVALGLAAGLAVPTTRREVELMGDARDQLVDRAREVAQETKDKVQHVAERAVGEAQTAAKQTAREEGLTSG